MWGSGVGMEQSEKWCGNGEVEMVRIKVEKRYMTTPMAWIRKLENNARGEQ